jgi:tRNA threonylcarbamoyladenosine modification (KEOPS) complex  Pcc1 subunit
MRISIQMMIFISTLIMVVAQPVSAAEGQQQEKGFFDKISDYAGEAIDKVGKVWDTLTTITSETGQSASGAVNQALDRAGKWASGVSTLVTGNMLIDIKAGDVTSLASGNNSTSDITIGTIGGSTLKDVLIDVDVNDVTSVASGEKSKSFVRIGSIENSKVDGIASINVKAKDVASIASGQESRSSIAMGSAY